MGIIWNELYPYGDFSGVRLTIDKDYVLQLKGSDGWISVEGVASGGERSLACLALRIASFGPQCAGNPRECFGADRRGGRCENTPTAPGNLLRG